MRFRLPRRRITACRLRRASAAPAKKVEVTLQDDKLRLVSNKASLAEVIKRTAHAVEGADIGVPVGADQEIVASCWDPGRSAK